MPTLKPGTIWPSEEEDKIITQHAIEDGNLLSNEEMAQMKPFREFVAEHPEIPELGTLLNEIDGNKKRGSVVVGDQVAL